MTESRGASPRGSGELAAGPAAAVIDADKLRGAIEAARSMPSYRGLGDDYWASCPREALHTIIAAAESTLPKTKLVEIWRVEFAQDKNPHSASFGSRHDADVYAQTVSCWPATACIRVTGPHEQEVPA